MELNLIKSVGKFLFSFLLPQNFNRCTNVALRITEELHKCKYCGVMTTENDFYCYKKPIQTKGLPRKKVYISGQITGVEDTAYEKFLKAEKRLELKGYKVINPMKLPHEHDKSWQAYMKEDLKHLLDCDAIYMLADWEASKGARLEYDLAELLNIIIMQEC